MRPARVSGPGMALLPFLGLAMASCATPLEYLPISPGEGRYLGYHDAPSGDGGHAIRVVMVSGPSAYEFWDRRASELCNGPPARKVIHTAIQQTVLYERYGGRPGAFQLEGLAYCAPSLSPGSAPVPGA